MPEESRDPNVLDEIWTALDPSGEQRELLEAVSSDRSLEAWMTALGVGAKGQLRQARKDALALQGLMKEIEAAFTSLTPRGWAVMRMESSAIKDALHLMASGQEEEADLLLAEQWRGEQAWKISNLCARVSVMGVPDPELKPLYQHRARLLRLAAEHHAQGRYEASIPIVHAQVEGIALDVTEGKKFFSKGGSWQADVYEPTQLVSIASGLMALQATYGQNVLTTQSAGALSRHGIAHGREVAYDTEVNSAKSWSLLDAVVEWAQPRMRELCEQRRKQREEAHAGSQDVDERGRRLDKREFAETRSMLRTLTDSAMGRHRRLGRFQSDLVGGVYREADFLKKGLPQEHGFQQYLSPDGQSIYYWRSTISGWVLGKGLRFEDGKPLELYYAQADPPSTFSLDDEWVSSFEPEGWH